MKILAIETSTMIGGVAVVDEERGVLSESRSAVRAGHSGRLMPEVDAVLSKVSLTLSDIDALCVTTGPGSFTGLRIGLSTVKGLAYATGLPVVAVPTLEAFAWNFPGCAHPVCPMLDARKSEVYAGIFKTDSGEVVRIMDEASIKPAELAERLKEFERVMLVGEGAIIYKNVFTDMLGDRALFAPAHMMSPSPSAAAELGMRKALKGEFSDPEALAPCYIRKSEAELKKK